MYQSIVLFLSLTSLLFSLPDATPPSFFSSVVAFGANEKMESGKPPPGAKKRRI